MEHYADMISYTPKSASPREAVVVIVCACGWLTAEYPTEDEARREYDAHLVEVEPK